VNADTRRLFDVQSAAGYLRELGAGTASVNFIRTLITSGQVPHIRIGKRFFVAREALDHWIESRQRRAKP
jgi:excisionase family DNA binding protein